MLTEKVQAGLNDQVNAEAYSAYLYLAMSSWAQSSNLPGAAHWLYAQAHEELIHALKIYLHILDRNGQAVLQPIEGPPKEWASIEAVFQGAYEHEKDITGRIDSLVNLAAEEGDHASNNFLQWYVTEQVEEESSTYQVWQKLRLAGGQGAALLFIDQELAARVPPFVIPVNLPPGDADVAAAPAGGGAA
jgi:ferritin